MAAVLIATGHVYGADYDVSPHQVLVEVSFCAPDIIDPPYGAVTNVAVNIGLLALTTQTNYKNAIVAGINSMLSTSYSASDLQIIGGGII